MKDKIKVIETYQKGSLTWFIFAGIIFSIVLGFTTALFLGSLAPSTNGFLAMIILLLVSFLIYLKGQKNFKYDKDCQIKLDKEAKTIKAKITAKYKAHDSDSNYNFVHYRFQDDFEVKVSIQENLYKTIKEGDEIVIEYLPKNPQISRLKEQNMF